MRVVARINLTAAVHYRQMQFVEGRCAKRESPSTAGLGRGDNITLEIS